MAQKVQFISAIVSKPRLLILDEPFSGLDPVNADALRDAVLSLRAIGHDHRVSRHTTCRRRAHVRPHFHDLQGQ
jgi:ABC-2 type transport system ATP-binding protein